MVSSIPQSKKARTLFWRAFCYGSTVPKSTKKQQKAPTLLFRSIWCQTNVTVFCVSLPSPLVLLVLFVHFGAFFVAAVVCLCHKVVHFAEGSSVPKSTKHYHKAPKLHFRAIRSQDCFGMFCVRLPSPLPPPSCFGCLSWRLMLFRRCSGFVYTTKHQKARVLFCRAFCCGFDYSKNHKKAPKLLFRAISF